MPSAKRSTSSSNTPLTAEQVDQLERMIASMIDHRAADNERLFDEAQQARNWSQLSGLHGIGTGLIMARRIFKEEFASIRREVQKKKKR